MMNLTEQLPEELSFPVTFEETKLESKKYVVNRDTNEPIAIVGSGFNCVSHKEFFQTVEETLLSSIPENELENSKVSFQSAHNGGFVMMDIVLPSNTTKIITDKREVSVSQRIIALHGIDGTCGNQTYFGAIDFFCTNGMISGNYGLVRRKNTSGFNIGVFGDELQKSSNDFYKFTELLQSWADSKISKKQAKTVIEDIIQSELKQRKMLELYNQEVTTRGANIYSLYSAFTNYASYADERNGFGLRESANDTGAVVMWKRENEVLKWTNSDSFIKLVA